MILSGVHFFLKSKIVEKNTASTDYCQMEEEMLVEQ